MDNVVRVWIDDRNPIFRAGLAGCLRAPGFVLAGESSEFVPEPDLQQTDVVVFDAGERNVGWVRANAGRCASGDTPGPGPARLVGVVGAGGPEEAGVGGLCTVLLRYELTPESFLACIRSLTTVPEPVGRRDHEPDVNASRRDAVTRLSPVEIDVLRHLADGRSPREIARLLGASERTVCGAVDDVVARLACRTPVQAVALALREGVI